MGSSTTWNEVQISVKNNAFPIPFSSIAYANIYLDTLTSLYKNITLSSFPRTFQLFSLAAIKPGKTGNEAIALRYRKRQIMLYIE